MTGQAMLSLNHNCIQAHHWCRAPLSGPPLYDGHGGGCRRGEGVRTHSVTCCMTRWRAASLSAGDSVRSRCGVRELT